MEKTYTIDRGAQPPTNHYLNQRVMENALGWRKMSVHEMDDSMGWVWIDDAHQGRAYHEINASNDTETIQRVLSDCLANGMIDQTFIESVTDKHPAEICIALLHHLNIPLDSRFLDIPI